MQIDTKLQNGLILELVAKLTYLYSPHAKYKLVYFSFTDQNLAAFSTDFKQARSRFLLPWFIVQLIWQQKAFNFVNDLNQYPDYLSGLLCMFLHCFRQPGM